MDKTWDRALEVLFSAMGMPLLADTTVSASNLQNFLRGRGFRVRRLALVNGIIPGSAEMVGGILEGSGPVFSAILGAPLEAVILPLDGSASRQLDPTDLNGIHYIWIFEDMSATTDAIAPFLSRYKGKLAELLLAAAIINVFAIILPLFSSFVYDKILGNGITDTLWALVIGLVIVMGVEFCVRTLRTQIAEQFAIASEVDIDHGVFRGLMDTQINKMPAMGSFIEKYRQVFSFRDFLSSSYLLALADMPFLLLFLAVIFIAAGPLVFVPIVCGGLTLLTGVFVAPIVMDYDRQAKVSGERRYGLIEDAMSAREVIAGSALRNEMSRHWGQASVSAATAASKARFWRGIGFTMTNSLAFLSFVSILVGGVYLIEAHALTSGGLLAASMLTSRAMAGASSVTTLMLRYKEFKVAMRELNKIIPHATKVSKPSRGDLSGDIRAEGITCRLRSDAAAILNDVSFHIPHGQIVCIAGNPGAGKTTLLRLISGVLTPERGRVLLDGIPLSHVSYEDISHNMGIKPQDFCLLDGTIEDNVRAGRPPLSSTERASVLETSALGAMFTTGGLNWGTQVGARGTQLSGGQRQLVALARAMLRAPAVLLLDEPTNGLGDQLEAYFAAQLQKLRGKSTVIISTHSPQLLSMCDRIIVIKDGIKAADGPRSEILRTS